MLEQIKLQGNFYEAISKWEMAKKIEQILASFKKYFANADHRHWLKNQHGTKTAGNTEYGSANHAFNINNLKVDSKMSINKNNLAGLSKIAMVANEKVNLMQEQKKSVDQKANGANELTTVLKNIFGRRN